MIRSALWVTSLVLHPIRLALSVLVHAFPINALHHVAHPLAPKHTFSFIDPESPTMEGSNYHSGEPSGGVGPFRSKSPYSSQRSSTRENCEYVFVDAWLIATFSARNLALGRERGVPFDHNLLSPVVRSKRTPIACTECRRRQVKVHTLVRIP